MSATVVDQQTAIPRAKAACKRAVEMVLDRKVVVALVDDETMAELHERFLGKSGPTDVLSFPARGDRGLRRYGAPRGDRPRDPSLA